jgi:hypothetical protein
VSGLVVKYMLTNSYKQFLRTYWLDIVLLVPFFKSMRLLGVAGNSFEYAKAMTKTKYVRKTVKIPKTVHERFFPNKSGDGTDKNTE